MAILSPTSTTTLDRVMHFSTIDGSPHLLIISDQMMEPDVPSILVRHGQGADGSLSKALLQIALDYLYVEAVD